MSGGCDRQRDEQEAQIDRLRRDRDEALQKEARATAALVAAREDLEAARADREAAERRIQLAVVAFDALRAAATSERTWIARLPQWDALGRALRGVPAMASASKPIEDRLALVEARLAKLEGGAPQPVIEAPGYVPASGCAECGNVPGMLHGVDCSQSNESRARRWAAR